MKIDILYLGGYQKSKLIQDNFNIAYFNFINTNVDFNIDLPTIYAKASSGFDLIYEIDQKQHHITIQDNNSLIEEVACLAREHNMRTITDEDFLGLYDVKDFIEIRSNNIYKTEDIIDIDLRIITNSVSKNEKIREDVDIVYIIDNLQTTHLNTYNYIDEITIDLNDNAQVCILTSNPEQQDIEIDQYDSKATFLTVDLKTDII